jgi:hypothetical protein
MAQMILQNPTDKYIDLHANVIFECRISDYNASLDLIQWCHDDFCTFGRLLGGPYDKRLQYKGLPRYFIVGDRQNGEWNLLIENVTNADLGGYKCVLTRKTNRFVKVESKTASLKLMSKYGLI